MVDSYSCLFLLLVLSISSSLVVFQLPRASVVDSIILCQSYMPFIRGISYTSIPGYVPLLEGPLRPLPLLIDERQPSAVRGRSEKQISVQNINGFTCTFVVFGKERSKDFATSSKENLCYCPGNVHFPLLNIK